MGRPHGRPHPSRLHLAAKYNRAAAIPGLIKAGGDVESGLFMNGVTPLQYAMRHGSWAAFRVLVRMGANVNRSNHMRQTPLHVVCSWANADAADLLLRWGADETRKDCNGESVSDYIPDIADAPARYRPGIKRLKKLLARVPQDRAWRRRGLVVMCRAAHQDRLRLEAEVPDTGAEATEQPRKRRSRRATSRRGKVKVELGRRAHGGGGMCTRTGNNDGVGAWLMAMADEDVFRNIVGFL